MSGCDHRMAKDADGGYFYCIHQCGETLTLEDAYQRMWKAEAEVKRLRASADYWQRMAEEALDELKERAGDK